MRLLIDANILLDVLQERHPHCEDSALIWKLCETGQAEGYVSAFTFANLVYVMRKELTAERIEAILKILGLIFQFTGLTVSDITNAAKMRWNDFEDAVQSSTAERLHVHYIITRNVRDFRESPIPAMTPGEYTALWRTAHS